MEKHGGKLTSIYYTSLALRSVLKPHKFEFPIKSPRPSPSKMAYYTNFKNRGYLSSKLQLQRLQEAAKVGSPVASFQVPVYVGGGPVENSTDDIRIPGQRDLETAAVAQAATPAAAAAPVSPSQQQLQ